MNPELLRVLHIGLGPIGQQVCQLCESKSIQIVGAVDINPDFQGQDLGVILSGTKSKVTVYPDVKTAMKHCQANVAVVTTCSSLVQILPTLEA